MAVRRTALGITIEEDQAAGDASIVSTADIPPIEHFRDLMVFPQWLGLSLCEAGWTQPMPVQSQALPLLMSGRDMIGIAQTGSGKTGAFLLPAIVHAAAQKPLSRASPGPCVLVVAPTRELAVQTSDESEKLLKYSSQCSGHRGGLRTCCFYGGGRKGDQLRKFTFDGAHIVVATPGRLMDFCQEGKVTLKRVTFLCLDEADRMLDMGFSGDMEQIGRAIRPERQTVFFSATWPKEVQTLARNLCAVAPVTIRVGRAGTNSDANGGGGGFEPDDPDALVARESIIQQVIVVDCPDEPKPWVKQEEIKRQMLDQHIKTVMAEGDTKMIVFVNQKDFATELSESLWKCGILVDHIHGGRPQETRLRTLDTFRKGSTRLLIATDVIGRGLDIPLVSHVVVYSMGGVEDYIHRIGRTGRGKDGKGHALLFFEYAANQPTAAKELISVLQKSRQQVPPQLEQIAQEVASGKRWSKDSSPNNDWGSSWGRWSGGRGGGGGWWSNNGRKTG